MTDTTIKKVSSEASPRGGKGQIYLASGKGVSMRLWIDEPGGKPSSRSRHAGLNRRVNLRGLRRGHKAYMGSRLPGH